MCHFSLTRPVAFNTAPRYDDNVYGAAITAKIHFSFDECTLSARWSPILDKPTDLGCKSTSKGCYHSHPSSPFTITIIIALRIS